MQTQFRGAPLIFPRGFWVLPAADPAAAFLLLVSCVWAAMFLLVYCIPISIAVLWGLFSETGSGRYGWLLPIYWTLRIQAVCAGLASLLPVFGALRHWRTRSPCARALRAVALHQAACLLCALPAFHLLESVADSSIRRAWLPFLALFMPQMLHWCTLGLYFLPGLILLVAFCAGRNGALLPGWRLPALALFLAVASSVPATLLNFFSSGLQ